MEASEGRAWSRMRGWIVGLMVAGLAASVLYLLAERNRRLYFLETQGRELVVQRGGWLPQHREPWHPKDDSLAETYAPIRLPEGASAISLARFEEREDLDRALFDILAGWAAERVETDDPEALAEANALLERAVRLAGISPEQRVRMRSLRAEVAWWEGRQQLERAAAILRASREQLELATDATPARARDAAAILEDLVPASDRLHKALITARTLRRDGPPEKKRPVAPQPDAPKEAPPAPQPSSEPAIATPEAP